MNTNTILIIDDEKALRESLADYFEDMEYNVVTAKDGESGLELFYKIQPDLVLCDLRMPNKSGLEVIQEMSDFNDSIPSIAVSGVGDISDVLEAIRKGAWEYIQKPIQDLEEVNYTVKKIIERSVLLRKQNEYHQKLQSELEKRTAQLNRTNQQLLKEIGDRRKAEEELRQKEMMLSSIINNIPHLIFVVDPRSNILLANDALLKTTRTDLVGKKIHHIFNDWKIASSNGRFLRKKPREGIPSVYKGFTVVHEDHGKRIFNIVETLLKTRRSEEINYLFTAVDVTEEKNFELKKEENNRLFEKTARMSSISVVAGGVTHEINQPLNGILLDTQTLGVLIKDEQLKESIAIAEIIDGISGGARRISEIIQQMRSLWVAEESENFETVDLNSAVHKTIDLMKNQVNNHLIDLKLDLDKDQLVLAAKSLHLEQILINLLSNSINSLDISSQSKKQIKIITRKNGDFVQISVKDNGIGFPENEFDKLSDPLYSSNKDSDGTGLGLAIVKSLAEKYQGEIKINSEEDHWAEIKIQFPIFKPEMVI